MNEAERTALGATVAQMPKPVRNIPIRVIITAMGSHHVTPLNKDLECKTSARGAPHSSYVPRSFKLVDHHNLACNVRYKFNSDNRSLCASSMVISHGDL